MKSWAKKRTRLTGHPQQESNPIRTLEKKVILLQGGKGKHKEKKRLREEPNGRILAYFFLSFFLLPILFFASRFRVVRLAIVLVPSTSQMDLSIFEYIARQLILFQPVAVVSFVRFLQFFSFFSFPRLLSLFSSLFTSSFFFPVLWCWLAVTK